MDATSSTNGRAEAGPAPADGGDAAATLDAFRALRGAVLQLHAAVAAQAETLAELTGAVLRHERALAALPPPNLAEARARVAAGGA